VQNLERFVKNTRIVSVIVYVGIENRRKKGMKAREIVHTAKFNNMLAVLVDCFL
jgi:hypothetical protein